MKNHRTYTYIVIIQQQEHEHTGNEGLSLATCDAYATRPHATLVRRMHARTRTYTHRLKRKTRTVLDSIQLLQNNVYVVLVEEGRVSEKILGKYLKKSKNDNIHKMKQKEEEKATHTLTTKRLV